MSQLVFPFKSWYSLSKFEVGFQTWFSNSTNLWTSLCIPLWTLTRFLIHASVYDICVMHYTSTNALRATCVYCHPRTAQRKFEILCRRFFSTSTTLSLNRSCWWESENKKQLRNLASLRFAHVELRVRFYGWLSFCWFSNRAHKINNSLRGKEGVEYFEKCPFLMGDEARCS